MATIEARLIPGLTLTLRLFPLGSDTQAAAVAMTEQTNRKGTYLATVTGQAGNFELKAEDGSANVIGDGFVWLQDDSGTYRPTDEPDFLAVGAPGQELPADSLPLWKKVAFLYKGFRNRFVTDTNTNQVSLFADNDTTVDQKSSISDNAGVKIRGKLQSGP